VVEEIKTLTEVCSQFMSMEADDVLKCAKTIRIRRRAVLKTTSFVGNSVE
jgi:hypothetical protein